MSLPAMLDDLPTDCLGTKTEQQGRDTCVGYKCTSMADQIPISCLLTFPDSQDAIPLATMSAG